MTEARNIEPIYKKIGIRICALRKHKKMSQEYLALLMDRSRSGVAAIERGERRIHAHTLLEFAYALNTSTRRLLEGASI